jgi:hypothetical protein
MIDVRLATKGDAEYLASNLRAEDRAEVEATTGQSPAVVVPKSFDVSTQCYAIRHASSQVDDQPCVIFGVADDAEAEGLGLVWLLATDDVYPVRRAVMEVSKQFIDYWIEQYPLGLHNIVDHRNLLHLRWCLRLGFVEIGQVWIDGLLFHHIYYNRQESDSV